MLMVFVTYKSNGLDKVAFNTRHGKAYYLVLSIAAESGWVRGHKVSTLALL
jgi:hypothetical protein